MATNGVHGPVPHKSGIKVVVVGAGFGGLGAAIECNRQGHDVEIYEQFPELKQLGDIISFMPNAGRIFYRWGDGVVAARMRPLSINHGGFDIHKFDSGEVALHQPPAVYVKEAAGYHGHRGELHEVVFDYVRKDLGIPIHLNQRIEEYFEEDGQSGIILASGEKASTLSLPLNRRVCANPELLGQCRRSDCIRWCPIKGPTGRPGL